MAIRAKTCLLVLLASFAVTELHCVHLVSDMNVVILETADEALELSNDVKVGSSYPGANDVESSSSGPSHWESLHLRREHQRNVTSAHQARIANPGDIRCFCNMAQCVTTSYMCKAEGGCFSDLSDFADAHRARHGCVDLLTREQQEECVSGVRTPGSKLMCCQHNMCNYIDSPLIRLMLNSTYLGGNEASNPNSGRVYFGSDVWLKAATIAVPICGGFILVLLIVLAVKILRKDSKRQTPSTRGGTYVQCQGGPLRGGANQHSKTRLLLEESYDKNMAHARLNFNPSNPPTNVPNKQNNVFPITHGASVGEHGGVQQPPCKNFIKWGSNNQDSASHV